MTALPECVQAAAAVVPGVDIVAIAGIVGTLLGAILGAAITWKVQQRQFAHEDRTRFHDRRLAVYAEFNEACDRVTADAHAGAADVHHLYQALRLIASEQVWAPARAVQATIAKLASAPAAEFATLEQALTNQQRELSGAIRRELGVE